MRNGGAVVGAGWQKEMLREYSDLISGASAPPSHKVSYWCGNVLVQKWCKVPLDAHLDRTGLVS